MIASSQYFRSSFHEHPTVWLPALWYHKYTLNSLVIHFWWGWHNSPQWARASSFTKSLGHTQRRTTVGTTPLEKWSARRRDLYLTTHNIQNRQTSMAPGGIRTHNLSRQADEDLRLRTRGHWNRIIHPLLPANIVPSGTDTSQEKSFILRNCALRCQHTELILHYKLAPCSECCIIYFGRFPGAWIVCADVSEHSLCSIFIGGVGGRITGTRLLGYWYWYWYWNS